MAGVKEEYGQVDNTYLVNHLGRTQANNFTPYSAQSSVSSFNVPLQYDSNLITPISATSSPNLTTISDPSMSMEPHIKTSPVVLSPTYGLYSPEDEFFPRYNPPMKHRDSGALHISIADNFFGPGSPFACSSPHFGSYGVSAQAPSVKASDPSPMFHNSPTTQSAEGYSSNGYYFRNQTPALGVSGYKSNSQTPIHIAPSSSSPPILIAPSPSILRPATAECSSEARCRNSKTSNQMSRPFKKLPEQKRSSIGQFNSLKVQKSGTKRSSAAQAATYEKLMAAAKIHHLSTEEHVLLQLRVRDGRKWDEIEKKYNFAFPGKAKSKECLQMKKMRLIERLLDWNEVEERALNLSHEASNVTGAGEWPAIAKLMPQFGSKHKWSAEGCHKHWDELQSKASISEYEQTQAQAEDFRRHRTSSSEFTQQSPSQQSWSDGSGSVSHSPYSDLPGHFMAAMSSTNMDDSRSRASDENVQQQMQQQSICHMQQQIVYQQRQQPQHQQQRQRQYEQVEQTRHHNWPSGH
ncbi:hypothetical protein WAI453_011419 [Rhynchosporium graminicola]|uniref:Myb-like domain-containing protein n=1 Tax=Rhynchosporium graminicola TaxID=2792576 RepID=A0A1E1KBX1_9HELO|nr:uncharacterized protein RCO7_05683 [Rhynchosporium commune]